MHAGIYVLFMKNTFIYYILCLNEIKGETRPTVAAYPLAEARHNRKKCCNEKSS